MSLSESFNDVARSKPVKAPTGFDSPGTVDYTLGTGTVVRTAPVASEDYRKAVEEASGMPVPEGLDVILDRSTLQRSPDGDKTHWLKFKFVPKQVTAESFDSSIAALQAKIATVGANAKLPYNGCGVVINIADLQLGKVDRLGGTKETVEGFYSAIAQAVAYIKRVKPAVVVLAELGDGIEGFGNVKAQHQTNDLALVEQISLHTELLTFAAVELSKHTKRLIVVGVPSNHTEVRENGKPVAGVHNDYGLLSLSNVKRAMSLNVEAFGHVEFAWPGEYEVSLTIEVARTKLGFMHGHNGSGNADRVPKYLEGQFAGNHPLQAAQIINSAHFHHLRIQNIIGGRWWFQSPALDRGSSWLGYINGQGGSQNGVVAYTIMDGQWSDFQLLKTM